jgi:hypothetical protein
MTPVVILAIDSRTPAFFLSPFVPALNFLIVAYLTTVAARAGLLITPEKAHIHIVLARVIDIAQVSNLALSFLTNVTATSIIATKSWCVRVVFKLDLMLTCALRLRHTGTRAC